jgi:hypothetical protein
MVVRTVGSQPDPMDLPALLSEDSPLAQDAQYTSYVPAGITLKPTTNAHEYYLLSPTELSPGAVHQLACTFDQYWLAHPQSGIRPTTRFILQNSQDSGWQDCPDGIVPVDSSAQPADKPAVTGKSTTQD